MVQDPNLRYRGVEREPLRGIPAALFIGGLLVAPCLALLEGTASRVSATLVVVAVALLWWRVLARGSVHEVTDREYIITYDSGEMVAFDLGSLADMRWRFVPYHGASVTLVNADTSLELPISRSRRGEMHALGSAISRLHPGRVYSDVRAMRALGLHW